jgi:hypothetical protein
MFVMVFANWYVEYLQFAVATIGGAAGKISQSLSGGLTLIDTTSDDRGSIQTRRKTLRILEGLVWWVVVVFSVL